MHFLASETYLRFQKIGTQRDTDNPKVIASFSLPSEGIFYYATEYDPEHRQFYGYIRGSACDGYQSFSFNAFNEEELRKVHVYKQSKPTRIQSLIPELKGDSRVKTLKNIRSVALSHNLKHRTL